jgi:hypothetical protein
LDPECGYAEDGECRDGKVPDDCPKRIKRPLILDDLGAEDEAQPPDDRGREEQDSDDGGEDDFSGNSIALGKGERLTAADCHDILVGANTRVVSFIAPSKAGKTSLIAGLYDLFLQGRQTTAIFRSSRTILGFERLCHLSRAASGQINADMERTRRAQGLGYFHLDVVREGERVGLLLGDRPGENFISGSGSLERMLELTELGRAATLVYLIDGRALVDPLKKGAPRGMAINILDAIVECGVLPSTPSLALVLTKADVVRLSGDEGAFARFEEIGTHVENRYRSKFASVTRYVTTASPEDAAESGARGEGLGELLEGLLADARQPYDSVRRVTTGNRMFERLGASRVAA